MADIEITDEASLEAWLKTRHRRDAEIIAFRADLRAFPFWIRQEGESDSIEPKPSTLPLLQLILAKFFSQKSTSKLYLVNRYPKLSTSSPAFAPFMAMSASAAENAASAAAKAAEAALESNEQSATAVVDAVDAVNRAHFFRKVADEIEASSWLAIGADAANLDAWHNPSRAPLWPTPAPDWFTKADRETRAIWAKDPLTWAFWEKWWDGVISGDMPFPPELLRDVALIEDDIWQAGPEAVAQAIARIEKIHVLRAELAALTQAMEDEDLSQVQRGATLAHRGHNNPPEMIEAIAIVQASAVDIAQALDDAREELAKPAPEPSRLKAIGTWMQSALMKAVGYCGVLTDKFLQEFAGEMGKQAATDVAWLIKGGIGVSMLTAFAKSMIAIWPS
jgi:hypothetical protein